MENIQEKIISLSKSKFRGSFHLNNKMKNYIKEKGIEAIRLHTYEIISKRLKPKNPLNDGKQTPYKQVHPVFVAQHACGFCCRSCLEKIHGISKNKELTESEVNYIVDFIVAWIEKERNVGD